MQGYQQQHQTASVLEERSDARRSDEMIAHPER